MLAIRNLSFSYGMVQALSDVGMTMQPGCVTCVMGRNGVGKTTLMKNLMGLLKPSRGSIKLGEKDVTPMPANKRAKLGIALVPQGRQIFPKLTIEENLRVGLEARSDGRRKIPKRFTICFRSSRRCRSEWEAICPAGSSSSW